MREGPFRTPKTATKIWMSKKSSTLACEHVPDSTNTLPFIRLIKKPFGPLNEKFYGKL